LSKNNKSILLIFALLIAVTLSLSAVSAEDVVADGDILSVDDSISEISLDDVSIGETANEMGSVEASSEDPSDTVSTDSDQGNFTDRDDSSWYVDSNVETTGDGSQASPYKTIKEAFEASNGVGTIYLASGIYNTTDDKNFNLASGGNLSIIGADRDETVIDFLSGQTKFLDVEYGSTFYLSNIKFINYFCYNGNYRLFTSTGNFTLNNFTLSNSYSRYDLIRLGGGTNIIENCNFINNKGNTIHIYAYDDSLSPNVSFNNCAFTNLSVPDMNGVGTSIKINLRNSNVQINYCNFTESPAAIQTVANYLLINNSNFKNNDVYNAIVYDRQKYGGAIRIYKGTVIIDSSKFENNTAIQGSSIYASVGTYQDNIINLTVINSEFETNNARDCIFYESKNGELFLENNRGIFSNSSFVDISTVSNVKSKLNLVVMENGTYDYESMIFNIIATLSDDNGNPINVSRASLYFNDELMASNLNFTKGVSNYTFKKFLNGTFLVNYTFDTNYYNFTDLDIKTAVINVSPILNKDIYVSTTGSDETGDGTEANPFKTVEKGLDIASNVLNANIYIQGGTYSFSTKKIIDTVGGTLNIIGYDGDVTIDMGSVSAFCNISERSNVSISNINFINGHYYSYNDRGIIDSNGNLTVRNCNFSNNMGYYTTVMGATLIDSCSFLNNTRYTGSGFDLYNCYCILNSTFYGSSEGSGIGSVYLRNNLNIIENSKFYNNAFITLDNARLSLIIDSCEFNNPNSNSISVSNNNNVSINNCTFSNSSQANIVLSGSNANVSVTNSKFINNTGTGTKSSIYDSNIAELYLENNTVIDNASPYVYAALTSTSSFITSPTTIVVLNNETVEVESFGAILKAKILDDNGNPIALSKLSFDFDGKTLEGNLIYDEFVAKSLGLYNGTYLVSASSNNLQNCTIKTGVLVITPLINKELYVSTTGSDETGDGTEANPYATLKKAVDEAVAYNNTIHVAEGVYAVDSALAIDTNTAIVNIVGSGANTIFDMNNVNEFITSISANSIVGLKDLTLANGYTSTVQKGGFITSSGKLTINNVNFVNSTARQGGAIFVNGGNVTVEDSYFENTSAIIGGAICGQNSYIYVLNSVFNKTTASNRAGAIQSTNYIYIKNNTFIDTSASTANNIYASGTIEGGVVLTVMDNETWNIDSSSVTFNASIMDDNNNPIYLSGISVSFYLDGIKIVSESIEGDVVTASANLKLNGVHSVSAILEGSYDITVKNATLNFSIPNLLHDIYISAEGNDDTGEGTSENPYASFTKAFSVAESLGAKIHVMSNYTFHRKISISGIIDITILGETSDINFKDCSGTVFYVNSDVTANFVNIKFSDNKNGRYQLLEINSGGSSSLINCTFENNVISTVGSSFFIFANLADELNLINCKFINNEISLNGNRYGVLIQGACNSNFINCTFANNNANSNNESTIDVTLISLYNTQSYPPGSWSPYNTQYNASIVNCTFENNIGGLLSSKVDLSIDNCTFENNHGRYLIISSSVSGGYGSSTHGLTIEKSSFVNNIANRLLVSEGVNTNKGLTVINNTFDSNKVHSIISNNANSVYAVYITKNIFNNSYGDVLVNSSNGVLTIFDNDLDLSNIGYVNLTSQAKINGSTFTLVVNDNGTYDILGSGLELNASLVDEDGHIIIGPTVYFTLNGEDVCSAILNPVAIKETQFNGEGEFIASAYTEAIYNLDALIVKTSLFNIVQITEKIIYVDILGSDETGDGSEENPYASLSRAIQDANAINNIIHIQAGEYENMVLGNTFTLADNQKLSIIGLPNDVDKVIIKNINQTFANIAHQVGEESENQFLLKNINFVDADLTSIFIRTSNLNSLVLEDVVLENFITNSFLVLTTDLTLINCTFDNINGAGNIEFSTFNLTVLDSIFSNSKGYELFSIGNVGIFISNSIFASNDFTQFMKIQYSASKILENNWWGNNTNADELRTLTGVDIANWIVAEVIANNSDIQIGDTVKFDLILKLNDGSELTSVLPIRIVQAIADNTAFNPESVEVVNNAATITGTVSGTGDITISIDNQDFVFDVKGYNAYIQAENVVIKVGENATIGFTLTDGNGPLANKEITISVNNVDYTASTDSNGIASVEIEGLAEGSYIATAYFAGDDLHEPTAGFGLVMVSNSVLTVDVPAVNYGEQGTIGLGLVDAESNPLSGFVIVSINGKNYNVFVNNGAGSLIIPDKLDAGEYNVIARLMGDSITEATTTFIVNKLQSDLSVTVSNISYGSPITINLDIADRTISGSAIVSIGGVEYAVDIVDGVATKVISAVLDADDYEVLAKFIGANYDIADAIGQFTVNPLNTNLNIGLSANEIKYGEDLVVDIGLTDENNNPLSSNVDLIIGDNEYMVAIINGIGSIVINDLDANNFTVSAKYNATNNYKDSADIASLTVKEDFDSNLSVKVDGNNIIFSLFDSTGKGLNGTVNVTIDDITAEVDIVDGKGVINNLTNGVHTISVNYLGDANHAPVNISESVNVVPENPVIVKKATIITYKNMVANTINAAVNGKNAGKNFSITLKDSAGKVLANKEVIMALNGKVYKLKTNAKGVASLRIAISKKGNYPIAVSFLGDDDYNGSFVLSNVKVNPQKVKLVVAEKKYKANMKSKVLTATLKSANNKFIKGKKLVFSINGKKYIAKTNKKGIAKVKVNLPKKKTYKVTVSFAGDNTFKAITKKGKVIIK